MLSTQKKADKDAQKFIHHYQGKEKKMSSLRQELSNKYRRKKIEMNFAKVIL